VPSHLRLTQLLLPKKRKEPHTNPHLQHQRDPEPALPQPLQHAGREIREHIPGANFIRRRRTRQDSRDGAEDLRRDERKRDVDARQRLQQDHAEADALHGIEEAEPQPQRAAEQRGRDGPPGPREIQPDGRRAPQHLAPARRAEADGENGQDPRVRLAERREHPQDGGPGEDEEDEDE